MKSFFRKLPFEVTTFLLAVFAVAIGFVLVLFPEASLDFICFFIGIGVGIKGLTKLILYIRDSKTNVSRTRDLIRASLIISLALILMIHPTPVLSLFPIMVGVGILVYGIFSLLNKKRDTLVFKATSIAAIVLGIVVINSPMLFAEASTLLVGLSLIAVGIFAIITDFKIKKNSKTFHLPSSDGYTEVEFKDVDEQ